MSIDFTIDFTNPYIRYSVIIIITFLVAFISSKIIKRLLHAYFETNSKLLKNDPTSYKFIKNAVGFLVYIIAIIIVFYLIPELKALGLTFLASAGIFTAVVAMASAQAFSNIISGIFIVIFKPFRVEDVIKIGEKYIGIVEDITLRHTIIRDFENQRVIIPNSIISSETVLNKSILDEAVCNFLEIPIPYSADIELVKDIICTQCKQHPYFIDKRTTEEKEQGFHTIPLRLIALENGVFTIRASIWTQNAAKGFVLKCDLREAIIQKLREQDIYIPIQTQRILMEK